MNNSRIIKVETERPEQVYSSQEIIDQVEIWLKHLPEAQRAKAIDVYRNSQIDMRASILPLDKIFSPMSFQEKNQHYIKASMELSKKALAKIFASTGVYPQEINCFICVSCTGFMIPSLDAYLIEEFSINQMVRRIPLTEVGCAGGTSALILADDYLRSHPNSRVLVLSHEIPTITFLINDLSMENIVSTAIFADGVAAVILSNVEGDGPGPEIKSSQMYHFPKSLHLMGFNLQNDGLKIVLDKDVPKAIANEFPNILGPFLEKNQIELAKIGPIILHPGGKRILEYAQKYLASLGKSIDESLEIFRTHGNMSSATVLFILQKIMEKKAVGQDPLSSGLMMSFGPGFTSHLIELSWSQC